MHYFWEKTLLMFVRQKILDKKFKQGWNLFVCKVLEEFGYLFQRFFHPQDFHS